MAVNTRMLALLVYECLRSNLALLDAPDYIHANHTHRVIYYLAKPLDWKPKFEYNGFDLAFLDSDENVVRAVDVPENLKLKRKPSTTPTC